MRAERPMRKRARSNPHTDLENDGNSRIVFKGLGKEIKEKIIAYAIKREAPTTASGQHGHSCAQALRLTCREMRALVDQQFQAVSIRFCDELLGSSFKRLGPLAAPLTKMLKADSGRCQRAEVLPVISGQLERLKRLIQSTRSHRNHLDVWCFFSSSDVLQIVEEQVVSLRRVRDANSSSESGVGGSSAQQATTDPPAKRAAVLSGGSGASGLSMGTSLLEGTRMLSSVLQEWETRATAAASGMQNLQLVVQLAIARTVSILLSQLPLLRAVEFSSSLLANLHPASLERLLQGLPTISALRIDLYNTAGNPWSGYDDLPALPPHLQRTMRSFDIVADRHHRLSIIAGLTDLSQLRLRFARPPDQDAMAFNTQLLSNYWRKAVSLQSLDISAPSSFPLSFSLLDGLSCLSNLQQLGVTCGPLQLPSPGALGAELSSLHGLSRLHLSFRSSATESCLADSDLSRMLSTMPHLRAVRIHATESMAESSAAYAPLFSCTTLTELHLSHTDCLGLRFPGPLPAMRTLVLDHVFNTSLELFASLSHLNNLQSLQVSVFVDQSTATPEKECRNMQIGLVLSLPLLAASLRHIDVQIGSNQSLLQEPLASLLLQLKTRRHCLPRKHRNVASAGSRGKEDAFLQSTPSAESSHTAQMNIPSAIR